jgi:putative oxidoreductase
MFGVLSVFLTRLLLVILFLPFSMLDKILNFRGAQAQARDVAPGALAAGLIVIGIAVETLMPLAILTGTADRAAGVVMAGYCMMTALLWKRFWKPGDFWQSSSGQGRTLFWDFLKNFSLAGGFLLLVVGTHGDAAAFLAHPLASSHPYARAMHP